MVSLVTLYRSNWADVHAMCGVTEQDLQRAAVVGPAVFAMASRRENVPSTSLSEMSMHVRQSWTLLDRAYTQCRRAITYFRFIEGDADTIAPSLRRNVGRRSTPDVPAVTPPTPATPATPVSTGPIVGGGASPFVK